MLAALQRFVRSTSVVTRTLIVMIGVLVLVLIGVVNEAVRVVREDRRAYVFDFVSRTAVTLALGLEAALLKERSLAECQMGQGATQARKSRALLAEPIIAGLSRNPERGEVFFVPRNGETVAVCGSDILGGRAAAAGEAGRILSSSVWTRVPGLLSSSTFLATSTPALLVEPPHYDASKQALFKILYDGYLAAGRRTGTQTVEHQGEQFAVSLAEVRGTNIIVFSYQPVRILEGIIFALTRELVKVGGVLSVAGLLLAGLALNRLWRPIRQIDDFAQALSAGRTPEPFKYRWRDEISGIFGSLGAMMAALRRRESEIAEFNEAQGDLLVFGQQLALAANEQAISAALTKYVPLILRVSKESVAIDLATQPPERVANRKGPRVTIQGSSCKVVLTEAESLYGTLNLEFTSLRPGPLHRTLIRGIASSLSSALHGLYLTQKALDAAVFGKEISACSMIQKAIVRLDSAGPSYDLASRYVPSKSVGGDWAGAYYDHDGRAALYIADVSGHGLVSAFASSVIAGVINTLHAASDEFPDVVSALRTLARISKTVMPEDRGFTLLAIRLDPARGTLSALNCGHGNPLVIGADGQRVPLQNGFNDLFKEGAEAELKVVECPFLPGSSLIMWTDGLLENAQYAGRKLRTSWLLKEFTAQSLSSTEPQTVADRVFASASEGIPESVDADDVCVIVVRARTADRADV